MFNLNAKTPQISQFSVEGVLGETSGEHEEGCVYPSASHTLGWWALCWGCPAENHLQLCWNSFETQLKRDPHLSEITSFLTHSTRIWWSWLQLYFPVGVVGASPALRPKVNLGCVWGSSGGRRAGNQENHSHLLLLQVPHSIWVKILQIQQHGSSSCWFRHSLAVAEEKQEDAGLLTVCSEH